MEAVLNKFVKIWNHTLNSNCHMWTGKTTKDGYGVVKISRKFIRVHRLSWETYMSEIPEGLFVLHKCDKPLCINPEHLFIGTHQDNMNDMKTKGRAVNKNKFKTHCKRGHELSGDNLVIYINRYYGKEMRQCKKCIGIRNRP